uniref:DUF834 domain-containing protein n=1 Tax=Oryza glaberrima TaxID=4538 RepID=I1PCZ2_ORYGL
MGARAGALELLLLLGGRGGLLLLGRHRHGGRRAWWGWWRALRQRGKEARQREPRPGERRPAAGWPWALGAGTDALVDLMGDAVAEAGVVGACGGGRGGGGGRHSGGCGRLLGGDQWHGSQFCRGGGWRWWHRCREQPPPLLQPRHLRPSIAANNRAPHLGRQRRDGGLDLWGL